MPSSGRCGGSCAHPEVTHPSGGCLEPPPNKGRPEIPSGPAALPQPRVPAESEGCRLCAVGWVLIGAKCYWISDGMNPWNKSREDCRDRGSALLVPWDQDELVKEMVALGMWDAAAPAGLVLPEGLNAPMESFPKSCVQSPRCVQAPPGACGRVQGTRLGLVARMRTEAVLG